MQLSQGGRHLAGAMTFAQDADLRPGNFFSSEMVYRKDTQYSDVQMYLVVEMETVRPLWTALNFAAS
jgi:hypothetical protein